MVWTICKIIIAVALLVGYSYYEYKWMLKRFRFPDGPYYTATKESLLPPIFMGGLVGLNMDFFDKWLEPHIASEGARFFLFTLVLVVFVIIVTLSLKKIAKRKIERERDNK